MTDSSAAPATTQPDPLDPFAARRRSSFPALSRSVPASSAGTLSGATDPLSPNIPRGAAAGIPSRMPPLGDGGTDTIGPGALGSLAPDPLMSAPAGLPTDPAALGQQPAGGPSKSPLDVLEDILKDAKGNAEEQQAKLAEQEADQVEKQQKADLEKLREEKRVEDEQKIQEQLVAMQQVKQSPEELERQRQESQHDQQQKEQLSADDGFEVVQLDHKKL